MRYPYISFGCIAALSLCMLNAAISPLQEAILRGDSIEELGGLATKTENKTALQVSTEQATKLMKLLLARKDDPISPYDRETFFDMAMTLVGEENIIDLEKKLVDHALRTRNAALLNALLHLGVIHPTDIPSNEWTIEFIAKLKKEPLHALIQRLQKSASIKDFWSHINESNPAIFSNFADTNPREAAYIMKLLLDHPNVSLDDYYNMKDHLSSESEWDPIDALLQFNSIAPIKKLLRSGVINLPELEERTGVTPEMKLALKAWADTFTSELNSITQQLKNGASVHDVIHYAQHHGVPQKKLATLFPREAARALQALLARTDSSKHDYYNIKNAVGGKDWNPIETLIQLNDASLIQKLLHLNIISMSDWQKKWYKKARIKTAFDVNAWVASQPAAVSLHEVIEQLENNTPIDNIIKYVEQSVPEGIANIYPNITVHAIELLLKRPNISKNDYFNMINALDTKSSDIADQLIQLNNADLILKLLKIDDNLRRRWETDLSFNTRSDVAEAVSASLPVLFPTPPSPIDKITLPSGLSSGIDITQKHVPILFLIDQEEDGGIGHTSLEEEGELSIKNDAIFGELRGLLAWSQKLIVASKGLTCGVLSLVNEQKDAYARGLKQIIDSDWVVYSVPDTQFTVWIPQRASKTMQFYDEQRQSGITREKYNQKIRKYYEDVLNLMGSQHSKPFERIATESRHTILDHCPSRFDDTIDIQEYTKNDLEKIFNLDGLVDKTLDLHIAGHGISGIKMVGLPVSKEVPEDKRITSLLSFFSKRVNTGLVWLDSCESGGQNTTLIQTRNDGIARDYDYILIIAASSDKPTVFSDAASLFLIDEFFKAAQAIPLRGNTFKNFLEKSTTLNLVRNSINLSKEPTVGDIRGYAAFPQIWFPGQIGFQSPNVPNQIRSIGKVDAAIHEQNNRPIEITNTLAVLWYPNLVKTTVNVLPATLPSQKEDSANQFHSTVELFDATPNSPVMLQLISQNFDGTKYPALYGFSQKIQETRREEALQPNIIEQIYPDFIIMGGRIPQRQWFKHIHIPQRNHPTMGILHFLRDAFSDLKESIEPRDIFIEKISGLNDFAIHMEAALINSATGTSPTTFLQKMQASSGQQIELNNIIIRSEQTSDRGLGYNPELIKHTSISFYIEYDKEYWHYKAPLTDIFKHHFLSSPINTPWNFQKLNGEELASFKESIKTFKGFFTDQQMPQQKSISEILVKRKGILSELKALDSNENSTTFIQERRMETSAPLSEEPTRPH